MPKGIFYVFAFVSDLERSKRFYRDVLGFELGTDEHGVAGLGFGSGYLVIHEDSRPAGQRTYGGGNCVCAQVENAAAEHDRLKAAGVAVTDVVHQPWGEISFEFTDPDGYRWIYGQMS